MTAETLQFQAEVSKLLEIVAHSLYSEKEIFLRELISNASDACDRLRYLAITKPDLIGDDAAFKITITADAKQRSLTIADNGVGMDRDDLVEQLGTIARSGSTAFLERMSGDSKTDISLIGQFGVGFYSAFMVASRIEVISRKAGDDQAWRWVSEGGDGFTVEEAERQARGTTVRLKLSKGQNEFLETDRLKQIVQTYSDHIGLPIVVVEQGVEEGGETADAEPVNRASAIWTRPKSEIKPEQYTEFFHHVGHSFGEPWLTIHAKAEGKIEYTMLLFVPADKPFDLFHPDRKNRLKLYVKRVFITDDCEDLVPAYLRFLRGVIDSEDLPLNISREVLQNNPLLARIRGAVVKRVLRELEKKADKKPDEYAKFWVNFGALIKEGIYEDSDNRDRLIGLARFRSNKADGLIALSEYVERMKENQQAIFYITGGDPESLAKSPQLEGFAAKDVEVLLLADAVDDFWLGVVPEFDGKPFKSVTRGGADLASLADSADAKPAACSGQDMAVLIAAFKQTLEGDVKDVRVSERLTDSPVCLVADEQDLDMHLERLLRAHNQIETAAQRILEVNPGHRLVVALGKLVRDKGIAGDVEEAARLLLDQARIIEGEPLPDPAAFSRRMAAFMAKGLAS